jgi:hypothetical protein
LEFDNLGNDVSSPAFTSLYKNNNNQKMIKLNKEISKTNIRCKLRAVQSPFGMKSGVKFAENLNTYRNLAF